MEAPRRAFVVVMDACGAGALPDAASYGDEGTNTLAHVAEAVGGLDVPTLGALGLGNVMPIAGVPPVADPAVHGRLAPLGHGKDTTAGHWELMGVPAPAMPVYPQGFPQDVIAEFSRATGRGVIGNAPSEGLRALEEHGVRHLRTGELIVYTSQDSVFQVAAHTSVVPEEELYRHCRAARAILTGRHAVGRVIARPFDGEPGSFRRTSGRHDFALEPPARTYLDVLVAGGAEVHAVGKVADVFANRGVTTVHPGHDNATALAAVDLLVDELDAGLVFANLVDTDQVYGHRKDVEGFAGALAEIDSAVAGWLERMRPGDLLCLCADHGVDPVHAGSDHTREHSPLLATFAGHDGRRADGPMASVGASALRWLTGRDDRLPGVPFTPALVSSK
ncbi:MAG: phosphopentomutase [Thermoleophilaceae bacterium]|nr:phosphopentomutase [Thermoleophilaceae bacterium]